MSEKIICDGEVCIYNERMKQWMNAITKHDGSYPDPIDDSPCDHCRKSF